MKYYNIKIIMKVIIIIFKFLIYETIHNEQKKKKIIEEIKILMTYLTKFIKRK